MCLVQTSIYDFHFVWGTGKMMFGTASCFSIRLTYELGLQEDASLFEDSELLHIYKGTYTAEYEAVHSKQGWKLISSSITL